MAAAAAGELPPGTGPRSAAAGEPPGSRAGYHLPAADPPQPLRDMYGFAVKPEFRELYQQFAPIYAAEEAERAERWGEFMLELKALLPSSPGGDEAALLSRLLTHLGDRSGSGSSNGGEGCAWAADSVSAEAAPPLLSPAHAAALLQRLASLVQAGLPMAKRGIFWRLFLNVESKRQAGEFGRLVAEVEALEGSLAGSRAGGSGAGGSGVCSPACSGEGAASAAKAAAAASGMQQEHHHAHEQQYCRHGQLAGQPGAAGVFSLVADASSSGAAAAAAAAADATLPPKQQYHRASAFSRVSTFSIIPLEEEEEDDEHQPQSPPPLPLPQPQQQHQEEQHRGTQALPAQRTPGLPSKTEQAPPAALTPASALRTPLVTSSTDGSSRGCEPGLHSGGSRGGSTAERWRQQDYLSQIDKDLHRTFPGHPCMDDNGRAMLRRILAAYARRNPSVGYCQGLNFLGATFLLFMQEEDAFWCLCALIEDILGSGYFDERMVPVQVDVLVFGHLLQGRFPTLWRHLQELDVDAASVTMHWFLCCFLNSLPLDSTLRVWDQLFFEGSPVVLFRVALALVEIYDQALMTTCESSDAYMALQACAQMTFDGSRLVDTAACGYAHLQRAGLAALRQRYKPEVLDNLRVAFQSEEEYELYVASEGVSPEGGGDSSSAGGDCGDGRVPHRLPSFADRFRTLSSALLEQEEAALRLQHQQRRGGDSGHWSPPRSLGSSSRHSSPGPDAGGPSVPGSPLARVQHAVRGLTSRLMPSSLPSLLPVGAMTVGGQELAPMSAGVGSIASGRSSRSAQAAATAAQQPASFATQPLPSGSSTEQEKPAAGLRRLSVCDRGAAAAGSSPTSSLSHSAGTGATLGRQAGGGSRLTPFSDADAVLTVQQQQQGGACTPDRQVLGTASRLRPAALSLAHGLGSGAAAAAPVTQSQPATPTEHITRDLMQQPESSHRRAMTAGHQDGTHGGHTRRRRRLTIDLLLNMANVRPDLQQPAVAAALAIAANPSPRVGGRSGSAAAVGADVKFPPGQCCQHSAPTSTLLELVAESSFCEDGSGGCSSSGLELLLPVRALRFDEEDARGSQQGEELPACAQEGSTGGLSASRRAATAPPAALLPPDSPVVGAAAQQQLQPAPRRHTADEPSLAAAAALAAASSPACLKRGSSQGGRRSSSSDSAAVQLEAPTALPGPGASAAAAVPSPARGPSLRCRLQQVQQVEAPALLPVVAQLQEEVAVAESRRHEAEQAAAAQRQTAADLRQQLRKVEQQVAAKEALVAELNSRLEASSSSLSEISSEVSAKQLAVLAEEAAAERRRRELAAADALIRRLMDAVAHVQHGGRSGGSMGGALSVGTGSSSARSEASGSPRLGQGQGQHAGSTASSSVAGGTSVSSAASSGAGNASPQSSIGSVPMAVGAGRWGGVPLPRDSASSHS